MGNKYIGPVASAIYPRLAALVAAGAFDIGPAVAQYEADEADEAGDGSGMLVTAGFVVRDGVAAVLESELVDFPRQYAR